MYQFSRVVSKVPGPSISNPEQWSSLNYFHRTTSQTFLAASSLHSFALRSPDVIVERENNPCAVCTVLSIDPPFFFFPLRESCLLRRSVWGSSVSLGNTENLIQASFLNLLKMHLLVVATCWQDAETEVAEISLFSLPLPTIQDYTL